MRKGFTTLAVLALIATPLTGVRGQDAKDQVAGFVDTHREELGQLAQSIWDLAEVGYLEEKSSALLQDRLRAAGFQVQSGVAGIPTAFVASYGSGAPVIGILAEFDALPGINQDRTPERNPVPGKGAGHACGHHLFGAGSTGAALAVKEWLASSGTRGTLRLYGTPAEEGGAGKVYMVREGLFDDVDYVIHWHASDRNDASHQTSLANKSAKFRFRGVSAHAAGAPWRARSALDGVEAMNDMVNMMREHVTPDSRIHYVITSGGSAPNVVPDFAEVYYYIRHPDPEEVRSMFDRVVKAAEGAALGTGTEVDFEVIHGIYAVLPNEAGSRAMYENLTRVGGITYDARELQFARAIRNTLPPDSPPIESAAEIAPFEFYRSGGSTDVADVSWAVPTAGLRVATWVPGTSSHSWQAVAAGGTSIGNKGMVVAAKTLAMTAVDLFTKPDLLASARSEFEGRRGPSFVYEPLLGDRPPPLDYRRSADPGGDR